ncbi:MAG: hypothetical protein UY72_C0062G0006 [Candidatus Uhrbacteria bacterium GW2011_GWD2_52_7]|uniref:DUF304 domain-containing protein n=1 Tax=Candidatus Uhrbacteria bacterium GW2011_GWD2_52_7 TaxID=1618989 RepID=A0A0G1XD33_9BACT|nr:MAG: hypothetical protein UY72_C0062G0006 [Candidatus Uhrbacteria bacterium GW2011_GWD2_52_7]
MVFIPEDGEVVIGVIRPSFWTLVRPLLGAGFFVVFPFIFMFALLGLGAFGVAVGALSLAVGFARLRAIRRRWLLGAMYVTDKRIADLVSISRKPLFVSVPWKTVDSVEIERGLIARMMGIGGLTIHANGSAVTLLVPSVHNPEAVRDFLVEVQSCHRV